MIVFSSLFFSVLWNPDTFLSFIGADKVVTEQKEDADTAAINRGRVSVYASTHLCGGILPLEITVGLLVSLLCNDKMS